MAGQMGYGLTEPPPQEKPPTYIGYSLLVTFLCCPPFGIVAVIFGLLTLSRTNSGDIEGAKRASDNAEKWMYASCGAAFLLAVARLALFIFGKFFGG